jgi:hypothetical protein
MRVAIVILMLSLSPVLFGVSMRNATGDFAYVTSGIGGTIGAAAAGLVCIAASLVIDRFRRA